MDKLGRVDPQPQTRIENGALTYALSTRIYPLLALFRTCYWLTDRCYIYFAPGPDENTVILRIQPKSGDLDPLAIAGEFLNSLLDNTLRVELAQETAAVRQLIYAQAFTEAGEPQRPADATLLKRP